MAEVGATAAGGGRAEAIQAGRPRARRRPACGAVRGSVCTGRRRGGKPAARSRSIGTARDSRRGTPPRGRPPPARSRSRPRPCRLVGGAEGGAKAGSGPVAAAAQTHVEERRRARGMARATVRVRVKEARCRRLLQRPRVTKAVGCRGRRQRPRSARLERGPRSPGRLGRHPHPPIPSTGPGMAARSRAQTRTRGAARARARARARATARTRAQARTGKTRAGSVHCPRC